MTAGFLHRTVFYCWIIAFGLVGTQLSWVLRPFIGDPGKPVQFFRPEAWDNAYVMVARTLRDALAR